MSRDGEYDTLFTSATPTNFAYHGYPWLIHRLTYWRANYDQLHVRGYKGGGHHLDAIRHGECATISTGSTW